MRTRRRALAISQMDLARRLGLTFQQVQKYERGGNRISASKLYEIAAALQAPMSYFFDGLPQPERDGEPAALPIYLIFDRLIENKGEALVASFPGIASTEVRAAPVRLVCAMAQADTPTYQSEPNTDLSDGRRENERGAPLR